MFDKEAYWRVRNAKKEGKMAKITPTNVIPKGEKVLREDGREVVNALGEHMVRTKKGMKMVSRKEFRQNKIRNRFGSASNYERVKTEYGFIHAVNPHKIESTYPAFMTNHMRHKERQIKRELARA